METVSAFDGTWVVLSPDLATPYLAAAVAADDPDAQAFVDWLVTEPARAMLTDLGFETP